MTAVVDLQIATQHQPLPSETQIRQWLDLVLEHLDISQAEITVRIVDDKESQQLNRDYRGKDKPTNVLSFPFEAPPGIELDLLGDLVICAAVVAQEANEQDKSLMNHWAHMILHGTLHLLGYDHIDDSEAEEMESLEIALLAKLEIDDPYQDQE
ncbi:rRNA maturation RNase YbeY [Neptunicella sp. SCSIO 80796]|uniref:rRNA maturation RNase YbeY n=1 Tax=Neptunicella plasticusilytica TaxID=3117012 RepID=UPI003A4D5A35